MFRTTWVACSLGIAACIAAGIAGCASLRPGAGPARSARGAMTQPAAGEAGFSRQQRQFAETVNALAVLKAQHGHYDQASRLLRVAIAQAPRAAYLHNNLGYVALLAGHLGEARAEFAYADRLAPGDPVVRANRVRLERALARREAAAPRMAQASPTLAAVPAQASPRALPDGLPVITAQTGQLVVHEVAPNIFVLRDPGAVTVAAAPAQASSGVEPAASDAAPRAQEPVRRLDVVNGNGVDGMARRVADYLEASIPLPAAHLFNQIPYRQRSTEIEYRHGMLHAARRLQQVLPQHPALVPMAPARRDACDLRVVLGRDAVRWASSLQTAPERTAEASARQRGGPIRPRG